MLYHQHSLSGHWGCFSARSLSFLLKNNTSSFFFPQQDALFCCIQALNPTSRHACMILLLEGFAASLLCSRSVGRSAGSGLWGPKQERGCYITWAALEFQALWLGSSGQSYVTKKDLQTVLNLRSSLITAVGTPVFPCALLINICPCVEDLTALSLQTVPLCILPGHDYTGSTWR